MPVLQPGGGEAQVGDQGRVHLVGLHAGRRDAGEAVELLAAERGGVFDRASDAVLELADTVRMAGDAALPHSPSRPPQVAQHLHEAVPGQAFASASLSKA